MMESMGNMLRELEEGKGMVYKKCRTRQCYQKKITLIDKTHQSLKQWKMGWIGPP